MTQAIDYRVFNCEYTCKDLNQNGVTFIHIQNADSPLLTQIHQELIVPYFSDTNDIDSLESIRTYKCSAKILSKNCLSYDVVVALNSRGRAVGATIFAIFIHNDIAFVKGEYTVVAPDARKNGTLEQLLHARKNIAYNECLSVGLTELAFVVIQVDSENDTIQSNNLQRMWRLHGFRRIDFPFKQLPLRDDLDSITTFDLFFKPLTEKYINRTYLSADEMLAIVDACCTFRESEKPLTYYKEYHQMREFISQRKRVAICL